MANVEYPKAKLSISKEETEKNALLIGIHIMVAHMYVKFNKWYDRRN